MGNTIKLRSNAHLRRMTNTEFVVHVMEYGSHFQIRESRGSFDA